MNASNTFAGRRLGNYLVLEQIGAGGMGVVYRAHDENLDRDVAIKFLYPDVLQEPGAHKRLRKEALALSRLSHPNIETIYTYEISNEIEYLVVELISGITLARRMEQALNEAEILAIGVQVAEALVAAHLQGVIHRDLKPANIFLADGNHVKVLDFGLASIRPRSEGDATQTLSVHVGPVGTLPYMSPEQILGRQTDQRSDIYSFGAILYEMAVRSRPFSAARPSQLVDLILHQMPASPRYLNRCISADLERSILKCLEKDPDDRYQSVRELLIDLKHCGEPRNPVAKPRRRTHWRGLVVAVAGALMLFSVAYRNWKVWWPPSHAAPAAAGAGAAVGSPKRVAILPFEPLGGGADDQYFAEGLTDELSGLLSHVHNVVVVSRIGSMSEKDPTARSNLGRALGVKYILGGSIQRGKAKVRVRAHITDSESETQLWAGSYDRDLNDVLAVENEVANAVVQALELTLGAGEQQILDTPPTKSPRAFDAYIRGKSLTVRFNNRGHEADFDAAIGALHNAITLDPGMGAAHAQLARLYYLHDIERGRQTPSRDRAQLTAEHALAVDPRQVDALGVLAFISNWNSENDKAYAYAQRALAINPHDASALITLGYTYRNWGLLDNALDAFDQASRSEPLYIYPMTDAAVVLAMQGRFQPAWSQNERAAAIEPENWAMLLNRVWIRYLEGRIDDADQLIANAKEHTKGEERIVPEMLHAWILSKRGRHSEAQAILRKAQRTSIVQNSPSFQMLLAEGLALEDQTEDSLRILQAVVAKKPNYPWLERDPNLDPLRSNPAFRSMLANVRSQWEQRVRQYSHTALARN